MLYACVHAAKSSVVHSIVIVYMKKDFVDMFMKDNYVALWTFDSISLED